MAYPEPIVVLQGGFVREALLAEEERGVVQVTVLVVRETGGTAEADAIRCERFIRRMDWEPYADAGDYRIVGIDTTAPAFEKTDPSSRCVWSFAVTVTVVREI